MELKSTASFKDVDIDAMLEHTTFDEFMRGLYNSRVLQRQQTATAQHPHMAQFEQMMGQVFGGEGEDEQSQLRLQFQRQGLQEAQEELARRELELSKSLEAQAIASVREKRRRREQSVIFDGSEKRKTLQAQEEDEVPGREAIDLTARQTEDAQEQRTEVDDELDILEAYVDPLDFKTQRKKAKLCREIELEKVKMQAKFLTRYARQDSDPFKIWS